MGEALREQEVLSHRIASMESDQAAFADAVERLRTALKDDSQIIEASGNANVRKIGNSHYVRSVAFVGSPSGAPEFASIKSVNKAFDIATMNADVFEQMIIQRAEHGDHLSFPPSPEGGLHPAAEQPAPRRLIFASEGFRPTDSGHAVM